jgi:very-short-patch-repair endonuclease
MIPNTHVDAVLEHLLEEAGVPCPVREFKFDEKRNWRFDYAWEQQKIALEVEGGRWRHKGAHNTGHAIERDVRKYNEAQLQGWLVMRTFPEILREPETIRLIARAFALRSA